MAHYAFLDDNNVVTEVITGIDETELIEGLAPDVWYGNFRGQKCVRTSYNNTIRVRYAMVGGTYREDLDAFILPKCHDEAVLNETTCDWDCSNAEHPVEV